MDSVDGNLNEQETKKTSDNAAVIASLSTSDVQTSTTPTSATNVSSTSNLTTSTGNSINDSETVDEKLKKTKSDISVTQSYSDDSESDSETSSDSSDDDTISEKKSSCQESIVVKETFVQNSSTNIEEAYTEFECLKKEINNILTKFDEKHENTVKTSLNQDQIKYLMKDLTDKIELISEKLTILTSIVGDINKDILQTFLTSSNLSKIQFELPHKGNERIEKLKNNLTKISSINEFTKQRVLVMLNTYTENKYQEKEIERIYNQISLAIATTNEKENLMKECIDRIRKACDIYVIYEILYNLKEEINILTNSDEQAKKCKQLENEIKKLDEEKNRIKMDLQYDLRISNEEKEKIKYELEKLNKEKESIRNELEYKFKKLNDEKNNIENELENYKELKFELNKSIDDNSKLENELMYVEKIKNEIEEKLIEELKKVDYMKKDLKNLQGDLSIEKTNNETKIKEFKDKINEKEKKIVELQEQLNNNKKRLEDNTKQLEYKNELLNQQLTELQNKHKNVNLLLNDKDKRINELENFLNSNNNINNIRNSAGEGLRKFDAPLFSIDLNLNLNKFNIEKNLKPAPQQLTKN